MSGTIELPFYRVRVQTDGVRREPNIKRADQSRSRFTFECLDRSIHLLLESHRIRCLACYQSKRVAINEPPQRCIQMPLAQEFRGMQPGREDAR